MKEERFNVLLEQYVTDMINKGDREEFLSLLEDKHYRSLLEKVMEDEWNHGEYEDYKNEEIGRLIERNVMEKIAAPKVIPISRGSVIWMRKIAAVAAILILIAAGYYVISGGSHQENVVTSTTENVATSVMPGSSKAILTLSNGEKISLNSSANGTIARQGEIRVEKKGDGFLHYVAEGKTKGVLFNTVTTPKGGQYHVKLADGTEVWLNAASSIRFPAAFAGDDRTVSITGETYFEVAHDAKKPFRVEVKGMQVEVLGTHFDINAYDDEGLSKTTLVQGKIKISKGKANAILLPGEQAQVDASNVLSVVKDADTKEVLAWKNGYFQFNNANIETVMKQLERWYDVQVVYEEVMPQGHINGEIARNTGTSKLLLILEASGIHCKMEGRKLIVAQ